MGTNVKIHDSVNKKNLRHVILSGCDWYIQADFHEGQRGDWDNPPMEDYWEIITIYNSEMQELSLGEIWDAVAERAEIIL